MPACNAAVGAVGVANDRDEIGGRRGPSGFDKEDALVLVAEAAAALIADDADGGDSGITVVCGTFEDAVARAGQVGWGQVGHGRRRWAAAAIMLTLRVQFLTTPAATRWARRGAFDTAATAAADKR